jgi:exopolyphosphatase/guanosine-5'-triphosphate,3'-diphosphate pyrophosphatase
MRIAAIDIGTNSIHMVIAEAQDANGFEVIDREREVVQVGRGSFRSSRLRPDAIRRTVEALQRYVQLARRHQVDRILCTATAAVREAANGGEFLRLAREVAGITPRVIPAAEEGRLIYLAVTSALELDDTPSLMVDIGGGSMQLVVGNRSRLIDATSVSVGALRLTEMLKGDDPPSRRDLQRLRRMIRRATKPALAEVLEHHPRQAYGSSGSIHALAHVSHWLEHEKPIEMINGYVLEIDTLRSLAKRLEAMTLAERESLPGIDSMRAEIILPGAMTLLHVLEETNVDGITISDFGVREGLVTDYIRNHAQEIASTGQVESLRMRAVLQTLTKFQGPPNHAQHVAKLALHLYDDLRPYHKLPDEARELLQFAALLHDVGSVIGYDGHGRHSSYIISHANLRGVSAEEHRLMALIAQYHGKARPKKRDRVFRSLTREERNTVRWLSAILSIAEGLDRSHYQLVRSVQAGRMRSEIVLKLDTRKDAQLEIWAARSRTGRLERLLGRRVRIRVPRETVTRVASEAARARESATPAGTENGKPRTKKTPGARKRVPSRS